MGIRQAIAGLVALVGVACSGEDARFLRVVYEGTLKDYGETRLTTVNDYGNDQFTVNLECEAWANPGSPFWTHSLVDERWSYRGKAFDYGVVPSLAGPPTKRVFPDDSETRDEFRQLEAAVQYALDARGKELKETDRKLTSMP